MHRIRALSLGCFLGFVPLWAFAQAPEREEWSFHGQATYVSQQKRAFSALYSGPNSLSTERAHSYSFTSTLFLGTRISEGGEFYVNPEAVQGLPLSNLTGLGGLTNGELQKTSGSNLKAYWARVFVRHTWGFGGGSEAVDPDVNQLAGAVDKRRLVLTAGKLGIMDVFDDNKYAHDPRADFFNWSLITSGAYDFAADSRGYSWGVALEWFDEGWAVRAGRFAQPKESNGLPIDFRIFAHYGDQVEFERSIAVGGRPGKVRLLAFRNVAIMGKFRDALAYAAANGTTPDVAPVRKRNVKAGYVVNAEQEITDDLGAFAKWSWNDGRTETYAFAEIDRSVAIGVALNGKRIGRERDVLGAAFVRNSLGSPHRDFLAAGGSGFFVGDGRITYRAEKIIDVYYNLALAKAIALSLDYQHARNPGYNADRGPVNFYAVRCHVEF